MSAIGKTGAFLEKLPTWAKIVGALVFFGTLVRGAWANVETAIGVVEDFGPLQTQVRALRGDYDEHVVKFVEHADGHATEHREIHEIQHQLQMAEDRDEARYDTLSLYLQWLECDRQRRRDEIEGRPARDCPPFALGGGG